MKKIIIITMVLGVIGYLVCQALIPDYVRVNRQTVSQCSQYKEICD